MKGLLLVHPATSRTLQQYWQLSLNATLPTTCCGELLEHRLDFLTRLGIITTFFRYFSYLNSVKCHCYVDYMYFVYLGCERYN